MDDGDDNNNNNNNNNDTKCDFVYLFGKKVRLRKKLRSSF